MIAARQIYIQGVRCNSCSLLNSLFSACGKNIRPPVPTSRTITNVTRFRASILPRRGFHSSTLRFSPTEIFDEVVESLVELVDSDPDPDPDLEPGSEVESQTEIQTEITEKKSVVRNSTEKDVGQAIGLVVEGTLSQVGTERKGSHEVAERKGHGDIGGKTEYVVIEKTESLIEELEEEELAEEAGQVAAESKEGGQDQVPWFLRVETPRPASHPFAQRQALPELPDNPPPALEPLLKHLGEELGINDLALIDLRSMDPPPAIGPDTIMVVGNARSERHLHISADKTCRWLRSEWKMVPYADGLLGRNEIKIKNRRLKKRGKLVSTETGVQDGVGWICVDVGSQGLVIQLFTPHRREEIDLEELWGKYLKNGGITKSPRSEPVSIEKIFAEKKPVRETEDTIIKYNPVVPTVRLGVGLSTGSSYFNTQKRTFHTTTPRRILENINPSDPLNPNSPYIIDAIEFRGLDVPKSIKGGKYWQLIKQLPPTYSPDSHGLVSELILRAHINHLKVKFPGLQATGSREGPCTLLGSGPEDKTSTDFLKTFYDNLPKTLTLKRFQIHLELLIEAHRITPAQYPASCLLLHLETMLASSIPPPSEFYYLVLSAFAGSSTYRETRLPPEEAVDAHLAAMDKVISHMKLHCPQPHADTPEFKFCFLRALTNRNLPLIQRIAGTVCDPTLPTPDSVIKKHDPKVHVGNYYLDPRIHVLDSELRKANHAYTLREYQETLLTAYAMAGAWVAFWNVWMRLRYSGVHRNEAFYGLVIGLLVMARNQRECVYAARMLVDGMAREVPNVMVTEGLAKGLLKVLEIAEGKMGVAIKGEGKEGEVVKGEWKRLRENCEAVIRRQKLRRMLRTKAMV